ncbi:MAG TPA: anhydro-N-acetylmuramic acid kinase [Verrucomicrobiae bacterium]|jgi:anhydro-N-acetylmuramic acid kinase|nr:anhydro-N-acetylmuramic acid kinase [Verrucomicrobiae bacterium]
MRNQSARSHFIIGLMSGTSTDGIDAVVAKISGTGRELRAQLIAHRQQTFAPALRQHILHVCLHGNVAEICELNFFLGEHFARAALAVIKQAKLKPRDIAAIGSHGQTIHHLPNAAHPSTLQIGEAAVIAELTGILTVADFRVRDMAAGGQGAPLVTYVDWALQTHEARPRILQNIGGIGNLTFLPPRAKLDQVIAFDTGPGNMVMDAVVAKLSNGQQRFDTNGRWGSRGKVHPSLLHELLQHPFLHRTPPKTTGREEFGEPFVQQLFRSARRLRLSDADIVATATGFTTATIYDAYQRFVFPKLRPGGQKELQVILGGGGAKNSTLRKMLAEKIAPATLLTQEDIGGSNAGKEAMAFAILAHETLQGQPSNVPSATGARRSVILGKITPA